MDLVFTYPIQLYFHLEKHKYSSQPLLISAS